MSSDFIATYKAQMKNGRGQGLEAQAAGRTLRPSRNKTARKGPQDPVPFLRCPSGRIQRLNSCCLVLIRRTHVIAEVIAETQSLEVLLGAADLEFLGVAKRRVPVLSALGFSHEVHAMLAIRFLDIRPVRVVASERRVDFEA